MARSYFDARQWPVMARKGLRMSHPGFRVASLASLPSSASGRFIREADESSANNLRVSQGRHTWQIEVLPHGAPEYTLLRLYGMEAAGFSVLRAAAVALAEGRAGRILFAEQLAMAAVDRSAGVVSGPPLVWALTRDDWSGVAELVAPFVADPKPGRFQWLTGGEAIYPLGVGPIAVLISGSADGSW